MATGERLEFTVHDRLRKARERTGMSQEELAAVIGVHRQTVSNYEIAATATRHLKRLVLKEWASACEVPLEWLTEGGPGLPGDSSTWTKRAA